MASNKFYEKCNRVMDCIKIIIIILRMFGVKKGQWLSQTNEWKSDDSDDSDFEIPGETKKLPRKRIKSRERRNAKQKRTSSKYFFLGEN